MGAVRSLARGVQQTGCDIKVLSIVDRFTLEDSRQWDGLDLCLLTPRGPKTFGYAPGFDRALSGACLDLLHAHGLWMYPSVAALRWARRWNRPLVVSPHGMLDPWAVRNSAWKKRLAGLLFEDAHLRRATCLHALGESEYEAIRTYGLKNPVAIIPNGVDLPEVRRETLRPEWSSVYSAKDKVAMFLGRIHPKKGLSNLLRAWSEVLKKLPSPAEPWRLVIAGWDQGGYQGELERLTDSLELGRKVQFVGPQFDQQKSASLIRADAFILPSFSEGLPIAVLEAWSYRLPVLMTPQCNLSEGFAVGAGIEALPEVASLSRALAKLFTMSESDRLAMGNKGRMLVEDRFTWPVVADEMCAVYSWVLGQGSQPSCVITC